MRKMKKNEKAEDNDNTYFVGRSAELLERRELFYYFNFYGEKNRQTHFEKEVDCSRKDNMQLQHMHLFPNQKKNSVGNLYSKERPCP